MGVAQGGECSEAHGHQFDEEEHEDCHERYAFGPVVVCYGTREARVCQGIAGWSEEVDECSCDYDAGAKVLRDEERPFGDSNASMATRVDWERGTCGCQVSDQIVNAPENGLLRVPNSEPTSMTKMAETRRPIRPS